MKIVKPKDIKNVRYHVVGMLFILLNYIRHSIVGYKTPRTFSIEEVDRSINYDFSVVGRWVKCLCSYLKETDPLRDKVVLELGPGPDLGVGLILLAMRVRKYIALDVNKLAAVPSLELYEKLLGRLKVKYPNCNVCYLKEQLNKCYKGKSSAISYIVDKNFEISAIIDKIDIVFSQASFEHFSDVEKTFKEISNVIGTGGVLIAEIDLKTHTRWLKDVDPLNIYRYSDFFWNLFKFKGSPNRTRAFEYRELLEKNGWNNIQIVPISVLENGYTRRILPSLYKRFRGMELSEAKMLSVIIMARKGKNKLTT